jgi:hypothetical protein
MPNRQKASSRSKDKTFKQLIVLLLVAGLLAACTGLMPASLSTPLPEEYLPTAAALTLAARGSRLTSPSAPAAIPKTTDSLTSSAPAPTLKSNAATIPPSPSNAIDAATAEQNALQTPELISASATPLPSPTPTITPTFDPVRGTATFTPGPPIPDARIQIYRLGELSKIISPLDVSLRLTCGEAETIRIELHGEDGRLLARYYRTYKNIPWDAARIGIPLVFEISSAAELGRLVISAEDSFGRLIEINSMDLVLLSQGMTELNPPSGLKQRIIIQDPVEKALIQNGHLIVSGRARPQYDQPLRVVLISEDGRILGQRLARVSPPVPGDYGNYIAEVPYEVSGVTPALLSVFEEGEEMSEATFLTSIQVILAQ